MGEFDVDEVEEEFGGVDVKGHGVADVFKVGLDGGDGACETEFSLREEVKLVEEGEGGGGGLVDAGDNDHLEFLLSGEEAACIPLAYSMFPRHLFEIRHNIIICRRV